MARCPNQGTTCPDCGAAGLPWLTKSSAAPVTRPAAPTPYEIHASVAAELASLSNDEICERFDSGHPMGPQSAFASPRSEWFFRTNTVPAASPTTPTPTPTHPATASPEGGAG